MACGCGTCSACVLRRPSASLRDARCGPLRQKLLQRLAPTVDAIRLRTSETIGQNAYDVFLVWERWTGKERGEGNENEIRRVQILPKPKVEDLTSLSLSPFAAGILPTGSVRLSRITTALSQDNLTGKAVPGQAYLAGCGSGLAYTGPPGGVPVQVASGEALAVGAPPAVRDHIPEPYEFFYELVEADAVGGRPTRAKFRLFSVPYRKPTQFGWMLVLERISEDRNRNGEPQIGADSED